MATKEEIIAGLELTVAQAKRSTALFAEGEWDWKRAGGWTPKEVYSHLAASAGAVPALVQGILAVPPNVDPSGAYDVNAINEKAVQSMASMTPDQVMEAFESNYRKVIDWLKTAPDEQLSERRMVMSEQIPISDILANIVMLHGLSHVFDASSRIGAPA